MKKYDCLIVDDEELLSQSTCEYFNMFEVATAWVESRDACLDFLRHNEVDLILLDINLGDTSGFELCKELRLSTNVPILFISARTSDDDKLIALNIGGDDYIQKPYSLAVLLAKVKAVLKRYRGGGDDVMARVLSGRKVDFTPMEHKLLNYLAKNQGRVISKNEIFKNVWQDAFSEDNTLNVHIRRLREKIEENPNEPQFIKTVRGVGYEFKA